MIGRNLCAFALLSLSISPAWILASSEQESSARSVGPHGGPLTNPFAGPIISPIQSAVPPLPQSPPPSAHHLPPGVQIPLGPPLPGSDEAQVYCSNYSTILRTATAQVTNQPFCLSTDTCVHFLANHIIRLAKVCGLNIKELRQERIVGGRSASYAEVPFIVHLRESQLFRVLGYNKCGGVLINHRWALTAAHCKPAFFSSLEIILGKHKTFEDAPPPEGSAMAAIVKLAAKSSQSSSSSASSSSSSSSSLSSVSSNEIDTGDSSSFGLGSSSGSPVSPWKKNHVMQVLADTVILHPDYDSKTLENDIALIKLKRPVAFREDIQPICLPAFNEDFTGLDGYATGWGLTDFDKRQLPDTLQIVRLPIISNKRCQSMYKKAGHDKLITEMDLCAGYAKGGMDACEGDSGGPLIVRRPNDHRWTLAGIVSNGVKCGEPLLPGVYTRVARFVPWIIEQIRKHS